MFYVLYILCKLIIWLSFSPFCILIICCSDSVNKEAPLCQMSDAKEILNTTKRSKPHACLFMMVFRRETGNSLVYTPLWHVSDGLSKAALARRRICQIHNLQQLQWGQKVFSQSPIVQVLPLKKMRGL